MVVQYEKIFTKVLPVLNIKKADFKMEGLKSITEQDIWRFLVSKKWKKMSEADLALHRVIADIFSLTAAQYMTFTQVEELKSANWFASINDEELQILIGNQHSPKITS
ncbi:post-transcriptional regulator [Rummeliibacillus pycnus]|uniref:post-transcriptional regulator n=1 Tax=Rummeliibacillus pycnus TaxID=101070 RepID=UPI003D2A6625